MLNSRRAASYLVRLVEGEEKKWVVSDYSQGVLPQNWGANQPNRTVTRMKLKATANDKRHLALCHDEFRRYHRVLPFAVHVFYEFVGVKKIQSPTDMFTKGTVLWRSDTDICKNDLKLNISFVEMLRETFKVYDYRLREFVMIPLTLLFLFGVYTPKVSRNGTEPNISQVCENQNKDAPGRLCSTDKSHHILLILRRQETTRGLLATDHVILNHGQVTWTTPELAPPLLTTTPHQREDVSALDRFNVHRCPTRRVFSGTRLELVTRQATIRYLYHSATAATHIVQERKTNNFSPNGTLRARIGILTFADLVHSPGDGITF
ncbi:uncharacterized protein TNCV_1400701 [Trichonephila clavipes]|nr:uncharacterized protein TNCV_1400701 [Trichonephila clavipes]